MMLKGTQDSQCFPSKSLVSCEKFSTQLHNVKSDFSSSHSDLDTTPFSHGYNLKLISDNLYEIEKGMDTIQSKDMNMVPSSSLNKQSLFTPLKHGVSDLKESNPETQIVNHCETNCKQATGIANKVKDSEKSVHLNFHYVDSISEEDDDEEKSNQLSRHPVVLQPKRISYNNPCENYPDLTFTHKRKRIMSTSTQMKGMKSISPKKKKGRKQSISNSEFESFYNAFVQHSKIQQKDFTGVTSDKCETQAQSEASFGAQVSGK